MRLLSIDIEGFKSFAKRVHVAFGPGITGVVGPNGSGKSNIAEAIRWVLGEQSTKALRASVRTDIIYSGSSGNATRALVILTLDNESGKFPLDAGEIAISRTLYRNGESKYTINGEDVRLIDLQHMLAQSGIGAKGYAVISQGTIDQYLTATPERRAELFDEATGIKPLKITLALSNQKLTKARTHADEIRAVLAELTPRVTFLRRQIDRYEQRDKLTQEFTQKQRSWYICKWHEIQKDIIRSQEQLLQIESDITQTRNSRIAAEETKIRLVLVPQESQTKTPWATQARKLLQKSQITLRSIINGETTEKKVLEALVTSITSILDTEERSIPRSAEYAAATAELEHVRDAEIGAEREGAAQAIALEQVKRDAHALEQEILRECGSEFLANIISAPAQETIPVNPQELRTISEKIASIGDRDELVVKEYEEASKRAEQFTIQLTDIEATMNDINECIKKVSVQIQETFDRQFKHIASVFQSFFVELFGGGDASLINNEAGIEITITPPRKRTRHVSLLSGGERALTSLALLLAILSAQEPPFIVLDEVDAALDEANSRRFAMLLKKHARATQSIVISHNRETMAASDTLYGVTMHADGVSTLYSVNMQDIAEHSLDVPSVAV